MTPAFQAWAVKSIAGDVRQLAMLRHWPGIRIAKDTDGLWLHGRWSDVGDEDRRQLLRSQLLSQQNATHYNVTDDGQLVPFGKRVPVGWLPDLEWRSMAEVVEFEWPTAGLAARSLQPLQLKLVRGTSVFHHAGTKPELLLCELSQLLPWVIAAPLRRLTGLHFACDNARRILVKGPVLPSVSGVSFSLLGALAVPLGWHWEPVLTPETITQLFTPPTGSIVVWFPDSSWEEVPDRCFQALSRSAIRATANRLWQVTEHGAADER